MTVKDDVHHLVDELVVLGANELAICRLCFESAAHFARPAGGGPLLFAPGATAVTAVIARELPA